MPEERKQENIDRRLVCPDAPTKQWKMEKLNQKNIDSFPSGTKFYIVSPDKLNEVAEIYKKYANDPVRMDEELRRISLDGKSHDKNSLVEYVNRTYETNLKAEETPGGSQEREQAETRAHDSTHVQRSVSHSSSIERDLGSIRAAHAGSPEMEASLAERSGQERGNQTSITETTRSQRSTGTQPQNPNDLLRHISKLSNRLSQKTSQAQAYSLSGRPSLGRQRSVQHVSPNKSKVPPLSSRRAMRQADIKNLQRFVSIAQRYKRNGISSPVLDRAVSSAVQVLTRERELKQQAQMSRAKMCSKQQVPEAGKAVQQGS